MPYMSSITSHAIARILWIAVGASVGMALALMFAGPSTSPFLLASLGGSLILGISDEAKYSLVAGAVAGGGLTMIANAPNPAGVALLRRGFSDESIGAGELLVGALLPTLVAIAAFTLQ